MIPACTCAQCRRARGVLHRSLRYPPPVEQTDPAARRVAWVLWVLAAVLVFMFLAFALSGCAPRIVPAPLRAKPPAYGHRIVSQ